MDKEIQSKWVIKHEIFEPDREAFYESLFSLGNGYMGVRGFAEEEPVKNTYDLCTYIAGVFDYFKPGITDMVNTPNFLSSRLNLAGEDFDFKNESITDFVHSLNMQEGTLTRGFICADSRGYKTKIETTRFLSVDKIHNAVIRYKITPLNYSGQIIFETAIDARVTNNPISDDQLKNNINPVDFLEEVEKRISEDGFGYISVTTKETEYKICESFSLTLSGAGTEMKFHEEFCEKDRYIAKKIEFYGQQGKEYFLDKMVAVYTSRDVCETELREIVIKSVAEAKELGYEGMYRRNVAAWDRKWQFADINIEGDEKAQLSIRFNIFQLIQGNAENDPKVSIGARGILHGRYKGCYFWDTEIFMFPFYAYTNPKAARNLLMYRFNTLPGAEENARRQSLEGARYAWMCTIDGMEQCDTWDTGCCEIHITADIAYAINQYYEITGDEEFIKNQGTEIYIKTARYWKSRFTYYKEKDCYNMLFVKGPNEYGGVTENNAFTTFMAVNNFKLAIQAIQLLKSKYCEEWLKLKSKLSFSELEVAGWTDIIDKVVINYDPQRKLYIEDDNFLKLEPLNIAEFKTDDTPLYHKISFDRLQRYMVLKQADVILLMLLLPEKFTEEEKSAAWNFYEPITLHDSTLSFGTHALFAAQLGLTEKAYEYFNKSLRLDLDDVMGNTGKEGLHFASFGATWQALISGFGGVGRSGELLNVTPILPETWNSLKFKIFFKGNLLEIYIAGENITITFFESMKENETLEIKIFGNLFTLTKGSVANFDTKMNKSEQI